MHFLVFLLAQESLDMMKKIFFSSASANILKKTKYLTKPSDLLAFCAMLSAFVPWKR